MQIIVDEYIKLIENRPWKRYADQADPVFPDPVFPRKRYADQADPVFHFGIPFQPPAESTYNDTDDSHISCARALCARSARRLVLDVLNERADLVGKTIAVRGLFDGSLQHGYMVRQGPDSEPCPGWRARFLTAPSMIPLDLGLTESKTMDHGVLSCVDAARRKGSGLTVEIVATVLRKSKYPLIFRRTDGLYFGMFGTGFGPNSQYPLMLLVHSAKCAN